MAQADAQTADGPTPAATPRDRTHDVGQLADEAPDTMTLHTRDAFRLFLGRRSNAAGQVVSIAGGVRFAATLKAIWYLSENDNPYADWMLIRASAGVTNLRGQLATAIREREAAIASLKQRGLALSVMASRSPKTVELGFRSPYGYATADLLVEYDYFVRMIKSLVLKDRMSDADGHAAIRQITRRIRTLFLEPIRWERYLFREVLRPLCRRDFLEGAGPEGEKRVAAAVALFGELPREVLTGASAPRHTRRRVRPTEAELRLLQQAPLTAADPAALSEAELI